MKNITAAIVGLLLAGSMYAVPAHAVDSVCDPASPGCVVPECDPAIGPCVATPTTPPQCDPAIGPCVVVPECDPAREAVSAEATTLRAQLVQSQVRAQRQRTTIQRLRAKLRALR